MKNKLLLIMLCVLFAFFTGCSNTNQIHTNEYTQYPTGRENKLVADQDAKGELNIEYCGFDTMLQEGWQLKTSLNIFEKLYPNVKLNFTFINVSEVDMLSYYTELSTRVMSGKGPDIFWMIDSTSGNMNKMIEANAFADLTDYFINDEYFNIEEYNNNIFYGSQRNGRQYIVPTEYIVPLFMTTETIVKETNFGYDKCTNYYDCINQILKIAKENIYKLPQDKIILNLDISRFFPYYTGVNFLSMNSKYDKSTISDVEKCYNAFKDIEKYENNTSIPSNFSQDLLYKQNALIGEIDFMQAVYNSRQLIKNGEEPILIPLKGIDGNIYPMIAQYLAVSQNSKNKDNAYKFIKTYISAETYAQNIPSSSAFYNFPISNKAITDYLMRPNVGENTNDMSESQLDAKIPAQFKENILNIIDNCKYYDVPATAQLIIQEEMLPYLKDEKSYEECIQSAQSKLEIYISE